MLHECKNCHKKAETLKMCAACSMVWYCDSECQKKDWLIHLVDCNPGRPITSADHLVASIYGCFAPKDEMALHDYGLTRSGTLAELQMRAQVYRILIVELQVKAKTIHRWMEEGILDTMMRETFDAKLPPHRRQQDTYYLWFRNNQSTFGRSPVSLWQSEIGMAVADATRAAWTFMGRDPSDSDGTIITAVRELSGDHKACFYLVNSLVSGLCPYKGIKIGLQHPWISFGFCASPDPRGKDVLRSGYMRLLQRVSYDALYQAYVSSSLASLFAENELAIDNPFILDVLSSRNYKSVWYLKEFACTDDDLARNIHADPSICADYGFNNCLNVDEVITLRNAYKQVFMRTDADPLALHEACLRGELFEYVGQSARLKPTQVFKQLMKNSYPL